MGMIDPARITVPIPGTTADDRAAHIKAAMNPQNTWPTGAAQPAIGTPAHRAVARRIAADSITLLKNDNHAIQKLRQAQNVLITGQAANNIGVMSGGWTFEFTGHTNNTSTTGGTTVLQALETRRPGTFVLRNSRGNNGTTALPTGTTPTTAIPADGNYDAIVVFVGESPHSESNTWANATGALTMRTGSNPTGNHNMVSDNFNDQGMLRAVYDYKLANPEVPLIVVMFSGRPKAIASPANLTTDNAALHVNNWDAFVWAGLPGSEGGNAIVDVLFGDRAFFGKTPYTWRTDFRRGGGGANDQWWIPYLDDTVVFPFGHGITTPLPPLPVVAP